MLHRVVHMCARMDSGIWLNQSIVYPIVSVFGIFVAKKRINIFAINWSIVGTQYTAAYNINKNVHTAHHITGTETARYLYVLDDADMVYGM